MKVDSAKDQWLMITIADLINPMTNEATSSFEVETFNLRDNVLYRIDQIKSGLSIENKCNYPCKSCLSTNPDYCTSCDLSTPLKYLEQGGCISECSKGTFLDKQENGQLVCDKCDPSCLTCEGSAKTCKSCGKTDFIHLRGTECVNECGPGYINDPSNHVCLPCREGCLECSNSVTNCTVCDQQGATPLFFDFDCLETCPSEVSILNSAALICEECNPNCKTCS